uniref:RNA-dependent RNA polymerase n=2 Tax=Nerine latent virus TaxID=797075 RepID=A0A8E6YKE4_9VIRU|nr:RNA-dependent RNA polymerase [Nerine latent virus]
MALTYRSPIEDVISSFTSSEQSLITTKAVSAYKGKEDELFDFFNYALPIKAKEKLINAGIYLSPYSGMVHSHPVCKTLENYMLYVVAAPLLDQSFYLVSIKKNKLSLLKRRCKSLETIEYLNRFVTSKDRIRYSNDFVGVDAEMPSTSYDACERRRNIMFPRNFSGKSRKLFFHDEIHYWSRSDLIYMLEQFRPECILATLVCPPEILAGSKESLNKWCYEYKIDGGKLHYYPDGVHSEGYTQPLDSSFLLKTKKIQLDDGETYCVDLIHSKFSHHLISITKGDAITDDVRTFGNFDAVSAGHLKPLGRNIGQAFPISINVISKIYRYLRTLQKPDVQSAIAKLGQLLVDPTGFEIKFIEEFAPLVIETGKMRSILMPDLLKIFKANMYRVLPDFFARMLKETSEVSLDKFIANLESFNFQVKLITLDSKISFFLQFQEEFSEESASHEPIIDDIFNGTISYNLKKIKEAEELERRKFLGSRHSIRLASDLAAKLFAFIFYRSFSDSDGRIKSCWSKIGGTYKALQKSKFGFLMKEATFLDARSKIEWRLRSLNFRYGKIYFSENNLRWFLEKVRRFNQKSLCNAECGLLPCSKKAYTQVLADICKLRKKEDHKKEDLDDGEKQTAEGEQWYIEADNEKFGEAMKLCEMAYNFDEHQGDPSLETLSTFSDIISGETLSSFICFQPVNNIDLFDKFFFFLDFTQNFMGASFEGFKMYKFLPNSVTLSDCANLILCENLVEAVAPAKISVDESPAEGEVREEKEAEVEIMETKNCEADGNEPTFLPSCFLTLSSNREYLQEFKVVKTVGDGDCFWQSLGYFLNQDGLALKKYVFSKVDTCSEDKELMRQKGDKVYAEQEAIGLAAKVLRIDIKIICPEMPFDIKVMGEESENLATLLLLKGHYDILLPKEDCAIVAVSETLNRRYQDVYRVLNREENSYILREMEEEKGVNLTTFERILSLFSIKGFCTVDGEIVVLNDGGNFEAYYCISEGHISKIKKQKFYDSQKQYPKLCNKLTSAMSKELEKIADIIPFTPSSTRATKLAQSFHEGRTGVLCSEIFNGMRKKEVSQIVPKSQNLNVILGTFGSGKSSLFVKVIQNESEKAISYVSPRRSLADEFDKRVRKNGKSKYKAFTVFTFEQFVKKMTRLRKGQTVIIDEIQLYPPGYLDLVLICTQHLELTYYITGDPCQSDYDSELDRGFFLGDPSDIDEVLKGKEYRFNAMSKRFRNKNFQKRLPCKMRELTIDDDFIILDGMKEFEELELKYKKVILVPGFEDKRIFSYNDSCEEVLTFGESTGRNFTWGCVVITHSSVQVSEKRWITALTRFSDGISLLNLTGENSANLEKIFDGRVLRKFLLQSANIEDFKKMLPGSPIFVENYGEKLGKNFMIKEEKVRGDPWLKGMLDLMQDEDQLEPEAMEIIMQKESCKTHVPRSNIEHIRSFFLQKLKAKEYRECMFRNNITNQFTDKYEKGNFKRLTNASERFEAIYPRHKGDDTATFLMAVKKRLRFSKPAQEVAKFRAAEPFGEYMLGVFLKHIKLNKNHEPQKMADAKREFEEKKTSKSAAVIENHSGRSCRDWLIDLGFLFIKNQLCTKFEKRFADAKAAQTILCFQHEVLCRFAPYVRYIEKKLNDALPAKYYIHSGKNIDDLNDWVKDNDFSGICTESDYEAFDASQDHYIMAFEVAIMKYLGLPRDLINDYIFIKTHLGSKLGSFAIMRFSGEASTFLFNTMSNMLFTFMKYEINGSESICFAGDDMCASKKLRLSDEHSSYLEKLRLKAKVCFTTRPTFCGWSLNRLGIFKKPQLVYERMCIAIEKNNLQNCIDNYAIEVSYAYLMGENALVLMDEEEIHNHYMCVRTIVQNKNLLRSDIYKVFQQA